MRRKDFSESKVSEVIDELLSQGCGVIGTSKTFGVDNMDEEEIIKAVGAKKVLKSVVHQIFLNYMV